MGLISNYVNSIVQTTVRAIRHISRSLSLRVFTGFLLLMVYTLTLSYKGSLNAVLTVTFFPKPMNTLQEIASQVLISVTFRYFCCWHVKRNV